MHSSADGEDRYQAIDSLFMLRVFYAFAALAVASLAISVLGKQAGDAVAMAGHTDDTRLHEIVIGNNVLAVPANAIRFEEARQDGVAERLDLYLRWPNLAGYTPETRDDFNNAGGDKRILFVSFEPQIMSRDMSGRFDPIYRSLIVTPGKPLQGDLEIFAFSDQSGYLDEVLVVGEDEAGGKFVARCLDGPAAAQSLAPCERDIHVGEQLSLVYRFPRELLGGWRALDAAVMAKAREFLRSDG